MRPQISLARSICSGEFVWLGAKTRTSNGRHSIFLNQFFQGSGCVCVCFYEIMSVGEWLGKVHGYSHCHHHYDIRIGMVGVVRALKKVKVKIGKLPEVFSTNIRAIHVI